MQFKPLQVTAFLASPLAVYDDYTPQLEGLLIFQLLIKLGLAHPNPSVEQVKQNMAIVDELLPIKKHPEHGFYYCSNPIYKYLSEEKSNFRKRWDANNKFINWGKRKAKIQTSEGAEKNYDLPLFIRLVNRIDWFIVGDKTHTKSLLQSVTGLGKKRAHGFGQVTQWQVTERESDWSILKDDELMKPVPIVVCKELGVKKFYNLMQWGYKPPIWLLENKTLCFMPEVVKRG
jgi:hypothetical protein